MTDILTSRTVGFSLEPPAGDVFRRDFPAGNDIARFIGERINETGCGWSFHQPTLEVEWSSVGCTRDGLDFYMVVNHFPTSEHKDRWVLQFGQRRGLLWFLTKARPDYLDDLISLVHRTMTDHGDRFFDVRRMGEEEFYREL